MKINERIKNFIISLAFLLFSYSICSSHEISSSGYVSRRKSFCGTPFYIIIFLAIIFNFFY